jgi:hypothetical protein
MRAMLAIGEVAVPAAPGAYAIRISPDQGLVPSGCPTRLIDIGGAGEGGSLYARVCTFIGAGLGHYAPGQAAPSHSGGINFASYRHRAANAWKITVLDLDVAYVAGPPGFEDFCAEVSAWHWYYHAYRPSIGTGNYPWCCSNARWSCPHPGRHRDHPWFSAPPAP